MNRVAIVVLVAEALVFLSFSTVRRLSQFVCEVSPLAASRRQILGTKYSTLVLSYWTAKFLAKLQNSCGHYVLTSSNCRVGYNRGGYTRQKSIPEVILAFKP
ncbi:hypothetical protein M758_1G084000 [Ceratodon purpureus]|nr:hypothetical protein M758_1G084000 [Ceratodon purpureus]